MKTKEVRGITIISLVVTIVVLLILAGISINAVIGDNGIIKKAQNSAELTKESEAKEIINRTVMEFYLTNDYETLEDFLNDKVLSGKIDKVEKNTDGTLKVWKDNYSVTVENKTNSSNNNDNNVNKTIKISAIPYEGIYDGNEHEAITNVKAEPTDAILAYSTDGTNYSTKIPTIINAGTFSIKIRASKENYETKIITVIAKIEKAEGIIDESLRQKYDIISKLNIAIKKVVTKKDYLKEYIDLKDKRISNYELDRKLTEAYNIILEVKNDHEELNTKEFNKDLKEIDKLNETLTSCKSYYNSNTSELNKIIRKVPTNLVAKIHGYKIKPFFDGKNMQDAVIDDFKL